MTVLRTEHKTDSNPWVKWIALHLANRLVQSMAVPSKGFDKKEMVL